MTMQVSYAVTVKGHDGIPDGAWQYTFFYPLGRSEDDSPYSTHPRVDVVCRSYAELVGEGAVRKHLLSEVTDRERGNWKWAGTPFEKISFVCPRSPFGGVRHFLSDNLDYNVEIVIRVQEDESDESGFPADRDGRVQYFRLVPFER